MTLPTNYTLPVRAIDSGQVGVDYHLALGTKSDPSLAAPDRIYGFMLAAPNGDRQGFKESTDLFSKQQLTQYSSPNLIDRDLVSTPRVTQGRWDGGQGQAVLLDATQYYDSDLDTRLAGGSAAIHPLPTFEGLPLDLPRASRGGTPGASGVSLRPLWQRLGLGVIGASTNSGEGGASARRLALVGQYVFASFSEDSGKVYRLTSAQALTTLTLSVPAYHLDSDLQYLYAASNAAIARYNTDGTLKDNVATSLNGTLRDMWVMKLGSNGFRPFYSNTIGQLWYIDLTATLPVAPASHVQVPFGGNPIMVADVAPYQTGVAILAGGFLSGSGPVDGVDVWYYDGQNTTPTLHIDGYYPSGGMCSCLGDLYVSVRPVAGTTSAEVWSISGGTARKVFSTGLPLGGQPDHQQRRAARLSSREWQQGLSAPALSDNRWSHE